MNIHCMHCGHNIELGAAYDAYSGPLRCSVCKGMMSVRIADGQLLAMGPFDPSAAAAAPPTPPPAAPVTAVFTAARPAPSDHPAGEPA